VQTDGALALAFDPFAAELSSAASPLTAKNCVNAFRRLGEHDAGDNVVDFPYWRLGNPPFGTKTASAKLEDQIGSTRLITDAAGASGTATTITYDPYGNVVSSSGCLATTMLFQGQDRDAPSGLYYLRARYYDPITAQFLTQDPMVAQTMSPYAYVAGDPLNRLDPTGMSGDTIDTTPPCYNGPTLACPDPASGNVYIIEYTGNVSCSDVFPNHPAPEPARTFDPTVQPNIPPNATSDNGSPGAGPNTAPEPFTGVNRPGNPGDSIP
jgi:RHS repeat-associated protein